MIKNCYLCGASELNIVQKGSRNNPDLSLLECEQCGLHQLSSFDATPDDYYTGANSNYPLKHIADDSRREKSLKNMLINKHVLDFGSGFSEFCNNVKKHTKSISAFDVDTDCASYYKKNNIPFFYDIRSLKKRHFDCITMFHVLEHLKNPIEIVNALKEKIKDGGCFFIEVPNANEALLSLYDSKEYSLFNTWEEHIFIYNAENLKYIAKKCDLRVDFVRQVQRYPLSNHLLWLQKGKPQGHVIYNFLNSKTLNDAYAKTLAELGACDTLMAKFTKV